jgi:hydroxyacyl-ACP dehydratase HTD2-like protein with hotdog domain
VHRGIRSSACRWTWHSRPAHGHVSLPPGWHGLYFLPNLDLFALRPDGTPCEDGVVPDVGLPRRLFAGEEMTFHRPVRIGETLDLTVTLDRMDEKQPGLLVHGRLTSMLLLDSALRHNPGRVPVTYGMRAVAPVYLGAPARLVGQPSPDGARLWVLDASEGVLVAAEVRFAATISA